MSMFTEYWIEIAGSAEDLASIRGDLSPGLVKVEEFTRDEFVLNPSRIHPDLLDESSEGVVGFDRADPFSSPDETHVGCTCEHEVFEASADRTRMWFSGEATGLEFLDLAERLSRRYPAVRIDVGGITEREVLRSWAVTAGESLIVDRGSFTDDFYECFEWYVRDGIRLARPLEVSLGDEFPATLSGEQFVHELGVASVGETPRG